MINVITVLKGKLYSILNIEHYLKLKELFAIQALHNSSPSKFKFFAIQALLSKRRRTLVNFPSNSVQREAINHSNNINLQGKTDAVGNKYQNGKMKTICKRKKLAG